ncbi:MULTISPECIES: O-antigen ligase [unclassified Microbacterium]|uniref:O-antigen ligase family protein n=1 Tax=unclassified Microbacterium TaxID=2609290 RepID=UPI001604B6CD|nr:MULTISPECIES: hypothetical protein [unclassified Microbacterium]QNA91991.1 hypothetical protein G4G29_05265 [Microbacterium sp. Se63.02b]QYM65221.1 hypothetical protein K1X59_05300 [Microbacterium sp. Se5.02b]
MLPTPGSIVSRAVSSDKTERARRKEFSLLSSIAFASLLVPGLAGAYLGDRSENEGADVLIVRFIVLAVLVVYAVHVCLSRRGEKGRRSVGIPLLIIFLVSTLQVTEILRGEVGQATDILNIAATGIVFFALWAIKPQLEWLRVFAVYGAIVGGIALLMSVATPSIAFMTNELGSFLGSYKGEGGQRLLAGPFANANSLGLVLSTCVPFVFLWKKTSARLLFLLFIVPPLWMTFARTSLISVGIMLVFAFLFSRKFISIGVKKFVAALIIVGISTVVVLLPILNTDPAFLTGRGRIWQTDLLAWSESPILGLGYGWYAEHAMFTGFAHTSSHNMMITLLVHGGLFYLLCSLVFVGLVLAASWRHLNAGRIVPFLFFIGFLTTGISEGNWQSLILTPLFMLRGFLFAAIIFSVPDRVANRDREVTTAPRSPSAK